MADVNISRYCRADMGGGRFCDARARGACPKCRIPLCGTHFRQSERQKFCPGNHPALRTFDKGRLK